jgi:predicted CXXCH cytochrome family protein
VKAKLAFVVALVLLQGVLLAQTNTDVLGSHDLGPLNKTVNGSVSLGCTYCHAPHGGTGTAPLWNQTLSTTQTYTPYGSTTMSNKDMTTPAPSSMLCMSCHDGSVGSPTPGDTAAYGKMQMNGSMKTEDQFGIQLQGSHPFSLQMPFQDSANLYSTLLSSQKTNNPKVQLVSGSVECTSCHNPHVQNTDPISPNFLVIDSSQGNLCLSCHDTNRTMNGKSSVVTDWTTSAHATSATQASSQIWTYNSVAQNACISCHKPHKAAGPTQLLRAPDPALTNVDAVGQSCAECHNGVNLQPPGAPDVFADYAKQGVTTGTQVGTAHPWPTVLNAHDPAEPAVLNGNRHSTCTDCHDAHASKQVTTFGDAPAIRISQLDAVGVSETDGQTALTATYQYQTCLRCHGASTNKQSTGYGYLPTRSISYASDPLNLIPQFASATVTKHVVFANSNGNVSPSQPSLLSNILLWDGTPGGRSLTYNSTLLCTDCHNSDSNREVRSGGGPNGPHGSIYPHILERRYDMNQAPVAGKTITVNLAVHPELTASGANPGPYALCAKCHDLSASGTGILSDTSFKPRVNAVTGIPAGGHYTHIWDQGISCSVCHTSHGIPGSMGTAMVDFDTNVVAQYNNQPITYDPANNTCTLQCHNYAHDSSGTVTYVAP